MRVNFGDRCIGTFGCRTDLALGLEILRFLLDPLAVLAVLTHEILRLFRRNISRLCEFQSFLVLTLPFFTLVIMSSTF